MSAYSDHEMFLRAALHAAADSLEPRASGLERIQARLRRPRPVAVVRATAVWNELIMRAPAAAQDAYYWLDHCVRVVWDQLQRASTPGRHRSSNEGWARPVILMLSVMFIVAAGAYTAITASSSIFPSNSGAQSSSHGNPPAGHSGGAAPAAAASHSYAPTRPRSTPTASCKPTAGTTTPAPAASPAASPTDNASPSPTPTDTSTSTDSSPADTGTSAPGPSDSVTASPTQNVPTTQPAAPAASATPCASS